MHKHKTQRERLRTAAGDRGTPLALSLERRWVTYTSPLAHTIHRRTAWWAHHRKAWVACVPTGRQQRPHLRATPPPTHGARGTHGVTLTKGGEDASTARPAQLGPAGGRAGAALLLVLREHGAHVVGLGGGGGHGRRGRRRRRRRRRGR